MCVRAGAFRAAAVSFERRAQFRAGAREFRAALIGGGRLRGCYKKGSEGQ